MNKTLKKQNNDHSFETDLPPKKFVSPRPPNPVVDLKFAARVLAFLKGKITWAQVEGWTAKQAYDFAKLGTDLIQSGQLEPAFKIFSCLHTINPKDWFFLYCLAQITRLQGRPTAAVQYLEKASEIDPDRPEILLLRALCLLANQNIPAAKKDLEKVESFPKEEVSEEIEKMKGIAQALLAMLKGSSEKNQSDSTFCPQNKLSSF